VGGAGKEVRKEGIKEVLKGVIPGCHTLSGLGSHTTPIRQCYTLTTQPASQIYRPPRPPGRSSLFQCTGSGLGRVLAIPLLSTPAHVLVMSLADAALALRGFPRSIVSRIASPWASHVLVVDLCCSWEACLRSEEEVQPMVTDGWLSLNWESGAVLYCLGVLKWK
jgi:hypothetical protein